CEHSAGIDAGPGQQDHELLAAVTSGDVAVADCALDALRDLPQHLVARKVAVSIVDALEVIDVDHEARERAALAAAARKLLAQTALQMGAVVPAGQDVGQPAPD